MAEALYTREILKLAMTLTPDDHLSDADGKAVLRSSICGSEMQVEIILDENAAISAFAINAKACAMGQASAAILKKHALGSTAAQIQDHLDALCKYLEIGGTLTENWPELAELKSAKDYPARHPAILLPYQALLAAFDDAAGKQAA